ncbi:MAG: aspartate kinase [Bacteroidota bacterium]
MKVFKFGGASVKEAAAVKNVAEIMKMFPGEKIICVISAMGKTTNALEKVVDSYMRKDSQSHELLNEVKTFHLNIMSDLFKDDKHQVYQDVNNFFVEVDWVLEEQQREYDFIYDQVVSIGELVSTRIVSAYLNELEISNIWFDVRDAIQTDNAYRDAKVDWELTTQLVKSKMLPLITRNAPVVITQGFIGSTSENYTTTLGREGSDYTAAILAHIADAEGVYIWKDVPGVLSADPKFFADAQKLEQISYLDAIELAYFGASVIHPKTIKPLENKGIPLYVKSFIKPESKGTLIAKDVETKPLIPSYIFKSNQVLISISAKDFSFIAEESLKQIFSAFADCHVKMNLMQNSAISFSVCCDDDEQKLPNLIDELKKNFRVLYNTDLQLYTIRHYYPSTIEKISQGKEVLLEQRSRHTAQMVLRVIED